MSSNGKPSLDYIAGLFDGEGSLTIAMREGGYAQKGGGLDPRLHLTNTFLPVLKQVQSIIGGTIEQQTPVSGHLPCYQLRWSAGKQIRLVLDALESRVIVKKRQFELMREFIDTLVYKNLGRRNSGGVPPEVIARREAIRLALRVQNRGGERIV